MDLAVLEQRVRLTQKTLDDAIQRQREAVKTYSQKKAIWFARLEQHPEAGQVPTETDRQMYRSMMKALDEWIDASRHALSVRVALKSAKDDLQSAKLNRAWKYVTSLGGLISQTTEAGGPQKKIK